MKACIGKTPIKIGNIIYYNGVKYKVIKVDDAKNETSIVFKAVVVK